MRHEESRPLFGKEVRFILNDIDPILTKEVIQPAYDEGLRLQKIFNYFDPLSELSLLNRKRMLNVSNELLYVIKKAMEIGRLTEGDYDIGLGKSIDNRKSGQIIQNNVTTSGIAVVGNTINLTDPATKIDLGSIAKGFIVDRMVESLKKQGVLSGLIDARGDIRCFGSSPQVIGIQHPREKEKLVCSIRIKNMSVATSGDYNQFYGSYDRPHILNGKDLISVTVVAKTLIEADILATAVFVAPKKETLISQYKSTRFLLIGGDQRPRYHNGFEKMVVS